MTAATPIAGDLPFDPAELRFNGPAAQPGAGDPFANLDALRLPQDFGGIAGVKKQIVRVPVQKPDKQKFVRVRSGEDWRLQTAILELKTDREFYLVAQPLWGELASEIRPVFLFTAVSKDGNVFLWPCYLPGADGRSNPWHESALSAALEAEKRWVRVVANQDAGSYDVLVATAPLPDPEWPDLTFQGLLKIAFKDRFVTGMDHPAIRRLRGEA